MHRPMNYYTTHIQHIHIQNTQHKHISTYINFLSLRSYCCNKLYIYIHIYAYICIYKYIYTHIQTHTHIHTHTHTYIYIYITFLQETLIVFATENWTFHITFVFLVLFCIIEINLLFEEGYTL